MARQGKNLSWKSWWKVCWSIYWNASWAVFLSSLVLSGCGESGSNQDGVDNGPQIIPLNVLKLQQPEDCGDLKNYVVTSLIERYTAIPAEAMQSMPDQRAFVNRLAEVAMEGIVSEPEEDPKTILNAINPIYPVS